MNHHFNPNTVEFKKEEDEDAKPLSILIEEAQLSEYFLLVRRIPGLSLSPEEFWELDTFTTQYLLDLEKEIMEEEQKASKGKSTHKYKEFSDKNSPEMNRLVMDLTEER